jgi:hypothetical protein
MDENFQEESGGSLVAEGTSVGTSEHISKKDAQKDVQKEASLTAVAAEIEKEAKEAKSSNSAKVAIAEASHDPQPNIPPAVGFSKQAERVQAQKLPEFKSAPEMAQIASLFYTLDTKFYYCGFVYKLNCLGADGMPLFKKV